MSEFVCPRCARLRPPGVPCVCGRARFLLALTILAALVLATLEVPPMTLPLFALLMTYALGLVMVHVLAGVAAMLPVFALWFCLAMLTRREPPRPFLPPAELAYREGRQCTTALHSWAGGYPDRCVEPEDHYGRCHP